jgi:AcrR family transcriptional regulator
MGLQERRTREKEQRRLQMLDAARSLVLKYGVFAVSVQQIAKLSELSVGTIYLYFESKEEIFASLQEEVLDLMYEEMEEAIEGATGPADGLRAIARMYNSFSIENKRYFDVVNYFLSPSDIIFPPHLKTEIDHHGNRILSLVVEVIERGVHEGIFEAENPKRCAIMLWATIHGLIQFRKLRDTILRDEDFDELYRYSVECFIAGLACAAQPLKQILPRK